MWVRLATYVRIHTAARKMDLQSGIVDLLSWCWCWFVCLLEVTFAHLHTGHTGHTSSNSTSCSSICECSQRNNDAKHSSTRRLLVWQGHGRKAASSYLCPILTHARSPISPPHRSLCPRVNPSTRPNLGSCVGSLRRSCAPCLRGRQRRTSDHTPRREELPGADEVSDAA